MANDYRVIGTPVIRPDGPEMISGQAVYGPDLTQPGMLWGKILRSPLPHARIRSIDVEKARQLPGVTVITVAGRPGPALRLRHRGRADLRGGQGALRRRARGRGGGAG